MLYLLLDRWYIELGGIMNPKRWFIISIEHNRWFGITTVHKNGLGSIVGCLYGTATWIDVLAALLGVLFI